MKKLFNAEHDVRFNEILFENRNKNYGAYVLRNEEGQILQKALLIGVALFGAIAMTPMLINAFKTPEVVINTPSGGIIFKDVDERVKPPELVKPITPVAPPKVNTIDTRVATPTRDAKEPKAISEADAKDAVPGISTSVGNPPSTTVAPPVVMDVPAASPPVTPVSPVVPDNNPVTKVDIEAKFGGGIDAFRNKVISNFNSGDFDGSGDMMKTMVTFIVEKDGSISNVKASGSNNKFNIEAEKTIRSVKGKWVPAQLNGEKVRSYFKFPISMQFE